MFVEPRFYRGFQFMQPATRKIFLYLAPQLEKHIMKVAKNKVVSIHYTLTSDKGEILDTESLMKEKLLSQKSAESK